MRINIDAKRYGDVTVLREIELDANPGDKIGILGTSGIGKSTFLRIIAGLDLDFKGQVSARPEAIGMVFQEPFLMNWKSASDNLTLMTGCSADTASRLLGEMGLEGLEHRLPQELSVGQQRRVSLARAFAVNPRLLILDEAFASLDDTTAHLMRENVSQYMQSHEAILILATHQSDDLALVNQIYTLQEGQLVS